ncbi:MAG TPA: ABC-2 family transporter protein [Candidatus Cybelea sp.]|nr:ABC-2 family transporter protein [Candidatus Cybelea sp.]
MNRLLHLVRAFWANSLALDLEYRIDFLISAVTALCSFGAGLLVLDVMFRYTQSLGGWDFHQALALYGIYLLLEEFATGFLAFNIGEVPELIRRGDLDFILLKPENSQLQVSIRHFRIVGLPAYLLALGILIYAMVEMHSVTVPNLVLLIAFLICAMAIIYAIWALLHTLAFWLVRVENISQIFFGVFKVARFPIGAFPGAMRIIFTVVIPITFMTTVPASAAAGILDWRLGLASPVIAVVGLWLSHRFWQFALRHYTSASS